MRTTTIVLSIFVALGIGAGALSAENAQADFSGAWVLDKAKTHNLPSQLKSYTMTVKQNEQQLAVETKLEGDLTPPAGEPGEGFPGGGGPPGGPGGGPPGGPGSGFPGGPGGGGFPPGGPGGGMPDGGPPSGLMALGMVIPTATYSLDGKETTANFEGPMPGTATLKAKWTKDGKGLELSAVRQINSQNNATITAKETWTLSKNGELLNLQRTVQTSFGTDKIKLTFNKEKGPEPREGGKERGEKDQ